MRQVAGPFGYIKYRPCSTHDQEPTIQHTMRVNGLSRVAECAIAGENFASHTLQIPDLLPLSAFSVMIAESYNQL